MWSSGSRAYADTHAAAYVYCHGKRAWCSSVAYPVASIYGYAAPWDYAPAYGYKRPCGHQTHRYSTPWGHACAYQYAGSYGHAHAYGYTCSYGHARAYRYARSDRHAGMSTWI